MAPVLQIEHLSKTFVRKSLFGKSASVKAVSDVSLSLEEGEVAGNRRGVRLWQDGHCQDHTGGPKGGLGHRKAGRQDHILRKGVAAAHPAKLPDGPPGPLRLDKSPHEGRRHSGRGAADTPHRRCGIAPRPRRRGAARGKDGSRRRHVKVPPHALRRPEAEGGAGPEPWQ